MGLFVLKLFREWLMAKRPAHEDPEKRVKNNPHVRAIVSSGYFNDPVMADFQNDGFKDAMPNLLR